MKAFPVDIKKFMALQARLKHVKYGLGAKARPLGVSAENLIKIDCSGHLRYSIYNSANKFMIPDGSWVQRKWFEDNEMEEVSYSFAQTAKNTLFVAFYTAGVNGVGNVGHVLSVYNGNTYESYSGKGVGSLKATNAWRTKHVHKTFIYPLTTDVNVATTKPYTLKQSSGVAISELPVFDGRSYVPARSWGVWFGMDVHWDASTQSVYLDGKIVNGEVKLIDNTAYVPFVEAAERASVSYTVDNEAREIRLRPKGV